MSTLPVSRKTYTRVFVALLALLLLTTGVNYVNLGRFNLPVALTISIAKAVLIVLFFMEVRNSPRIVWLFAGAGLVWLFILLGLTWSDYWSRAWSQPDWLSGVHGSNHLGFPPGAQ